MQSNRKKGIYPNNETRTFKITRGSHYLAYGRVKHVPFIRLRGEWLERVGFQAGQQISVSIFKNRLVIIPVNTIEK